MRKPNNCEARNRATRRDFLRLGIAGSVGFMVDTKIAEARIDYSGVVHQHFPKIERNLDWSSPGLEEQMIYWEHFPDEDKEGIDVEGIEDRTHRVVTWHRIKSRNQIPVYDHQRGIYKAFWHDNGLQRLITTDNFYDTDTNYDPEQYDLQFWPFEKRAQLLDPRRQCDEDPFAEIPDE